MISRIGEIFTGEHAKLFLETLRKIFRRIEPYRHREFSHLDIWFLPQQTASLFQTNAVDKGRNILASKRTKLVIECRRRHTHVACELLTIIIGIINMLFHAVDGSLQEQFIG